MASIRETELPTDLVAGLLMAAASAPAPRSRRGDRLTLKTYAVMAVTTALTFATLTAGYQALFTPQLFA